ncbi:MAG TPA: class I SAM-dependent methyltransferase, partial [Actinoplanes sp.]
DTSTAMIEQARVRHPAARFDVLASPPWLTGPDASVDLVILFAVLTCVPDDAAQRALIGELRRVLRPGGTLYLSDLLLQRDKQYDCTGVFETSDGAVCRHHTSDWLVELLAGFTVAGTRRISVATMNGNRADGIQLLARKSA